MAITHNGCAITEYNGGFVWEDLEYGAESEDVFPTVDAAKADVDRYFSQTKPLQPHEYDYGPWCGPDAAYWDER